jgi:hypothetical protein
MTARRSRRSSQIVEATLHPDIDALLWIFARASARIALEDQEAALERRRASRPKRNRKKTDGAYAATAS